MLMGFERDYAINIPQSVQRKDETLDMEIRASLIGNSFNCFNIAMVLASLFVRWGFLSRMTSASEIRDGTITELTAWRQRVRSRTRLRV